MTSPYRSLPSVDRFLSDDRILSLVSSYSREAVLDLVKAQLDDTRRAITSGAEAPALDELVDAIEARASAQWSPWPAPIVNATGVILHTNLGRAPLSHEATEAARLAATGYSDLELDLHTGRRGSRQAYIGGLLCQLTGAEAAIVVNNNASEWATIAKPADWTIATPRATAVAAVVTGRRASGPMPISSNAS